MKLFEKKVLFSFLILTTAICMTGCDSILEKANIKKAVNKRSDFCQKMTSEVEAVIQEVQKNPSMSEEDVFAYGRKQADIFEESLKNLESIDLTGCPEKFIAAWKRTNDSQRKLIEVFRNSKGDSLEDWQKLIESECINFNKIEEEFFEVTRKCGVNFKEKAPTP